MANPAKFEACYQEFIHNLSRWAPDGVLSVDLVLLHRLGIVSAEEEESGHATHPLTQYFHVIETTDKITLFNDQFLIWIVPQLVNEIPVTYTLVAIIGETEKPRLELVFSTTGIYNSSRFVLRVLEQLLDDIQENEELLAKIIETS